MVISHDFQRDIRTGDMPVVLDVILVEFIAEATVIGLIHQELK